MSDYHHLKPGAWKKRVLTCEFSQPRANGHGRSVSRFTVISNTADTEVETVQSYDPYRGSRMLQPCNSQVSHAKITVHRDQAGGSTHANHASRMRSGSNVRRGRANSSKASNGARPPSSRGSMTSLHSNRGTPRVRGPNLRHKRGVDFSHVRKRSSSAGPSCPEIPQVASGSTLVSNSALRDEISRSQSPELPAQADGQPPKAKGAPGAEDPTAIFNEELRHFSSNIAKDCDDAFKSSLIEDESIAGSLAEADNQQRTSSFAFSVDGSRNTTPMTDVSSKPWNSRPLPPLPPDHTGGLASSVCENDDEKPVEHIARLAVPISAPRQTDRRVVSAPVQSHHSKKHVGMPSINEDKAVDVVSGDKVRIVSAPPHTPPKRTHGRGVEYLAKVENTIRVVNSPSAPSPVKVPKPLNVRKKSANQASMSEEQPADGEDGSQNGSAHGSLEGMKKKRSWFRRISKAQTERTASTSGTSQEQLTQIGSHNGLEGDSGSAEAGVIKKKTFSFPFFKSNRSADLRMSITGKSSLSSLRMMLTRKEDPDDGVSKGQVTKKPANKKQWRESNATEGSRNIEVKQNWLARLFNVKPATTYLCMSISRRRARQEVTILLREWRRYGIRGIQVDKQRNIIFARVGAKNCEFSLG